MADVSTIATQLAAVVPEIDQLVADAELGPRNGRPDQFLKLLEEQAQAIAAAIVAPFRGKALPVNPPRFVSADGTRAGW